MQSLPVARYSPMVRIGNWYEEICLEQDKVMKFMKKREAGSLLVEKTRALFDNFHRPITLEAAKEFVRFGSVVQLLPVSMKICNDSEINRSATLSVVINERAVQKSQRLCEECEITIAPALKPNVRNSFRVVSVDGKNQPGDELHYKQKFGLETVDASAKPLLLFSLPKCQNLNMYITTTFDSVKRGEINQPIGLVAKDNCGPGKVVSHGYCKWYCEHIEPSFRYESESYSVPTNQVLVIKHYATNKSLAAENTAIQTLFGPEYLTSVTDYKNIFQREIWKNQWIIGNGSHLKKV